MANMSQEQKNDHIDCLAWQPSASIEHLKRRAKLMAIIRDFFAKREILEIETPLLSHASVTDPYVLGIPARFQHHGATSETAVYLQTSPEYPMKRLLAAGSGSIYQISKAFRQGDMGRYHNPEFTLLEWYRLGFNHLDLMNEVDALLQTVLHCEPADRVTYSELFTTLLGINPHTASTEQLMQYVQDHIEITTVDNDRNTCLHLLLTHCIEPRIGRHRPLCIYDFPITQAALAKIRDTENPPVASRFEVYFRGLELANGFHELQDSDEQRERFHQDILYRVKHQIPSVPIDEHFLAALQAGLPDCAGVALGIDRLMMLALHADSISDVMSFAFDRA